MTKLQTLFEALATYLPYQGDKYISPAKAGPLAKDMENLRATAQVARASFIEIAERFAQQVPGFHLERTSQWMNQAQILRPHFWAYFIEEGMASDQPALALRLLNDIHILGISLEVSCIERQKSDRTLILQNQVLQVPTDARLYYFAQIDGVSQRFTMTDPNRLLLLEGVAERKVRKVQVKFDVPDLTVYHHWSDLLAQLQIGWNLLQPYYQATKV